MVEHGVEVFADAAQRRLLDSDGAAVFSKFVVEMLEPQRYPEVRLQPGKDILRPYDVATWTLPLAMGVTFSTPRFQKTSRSSESRRRSTPLKLSPLRTLFPIHRSIGWPQPAPKAPQLNAALKKGAVSFCETRGRSTRRGFEVLVPGSLSGACFGADRHRPRRRLHTRSAHSRPGSASLKSPRRHLQILDRGDRRRLD